MVCTLPEGIQEYVSLPTDDISNTKRTSRKLTFPEWPYYLKYHQSTAKFALCGWIHRSAFLFPAVIMWRLRGEPCFLYQPPKHTYKLEYMIRCMRMDNENEASPENKQSFQDIYDKDLIISNTITFALLLSTLRMFHLLSYVFYEIKQRITLFKPCIDIFWIKKKYNKWKKITAVT